MTYSLKQKLGAIVYDLPRFLWAMRPSSRQPWVFMRNRDERLSAVSGRRSPVGAACEWQWTSESHLANVFPQLGRLLMRRALHDWPIESRDEPRQNTLSSPALSFIIGHRGKERLPHLLATLRALAGQHDAAFECIVVEQSISPEIGDQLPGWVRYVHTPLPYADMPYSRAWAFNVGARAARAEALVLHDNDMLVPAQYGREIIKRVREGFEVINLQRFTFYLTASHSAKVLAGAESLSNCLSETVVQNLLGGGTVAITRGAYFAIGGFDESFIGWGGEDNEFWQRAQTRRVWPFAYLPVIHLWHLAQIDKFHHVRPTAELLEMRTAISSQERIEELSSRDFGRLAQTEQGIAS